MGEKRETKHAPAKTEQRPGLLRPFEEMERWYESFAPRALWRGFPDWTALQSASFAHRMPAVDMIDRDKDVLVRAEVPGVRKEDISISVSDSALTIKGHTEHEEEKRREDYYYHEISYGDFTRRLELPAEVDAAKAKATMRDGVLEIELPKIETGKRRELNVEIR